MIEEAPYTSNAFRHLWEIAKTDLSEDELKWFVSLTEQARLETSNIVQTLGAFAILMDSDVSKSYKPADEQLSKMFFSLSYQLDHIAGLIEIGANARERLKQIK